MIRPPGSNLLIKIDAQFSSRLSRNTEFERQVFEGELEDVEGQLCWIGAMDRYAKRCFSALRKRRD
jgi:hypothetical protein